MRPLGANELLRVWEEGWDRDPVSRSLLLLSRACPDQDPAELEALPIGERDARLLRFRRWMFGSSVVGTSTCPACGERVELAFELPEEAPVTSASGEVIEEDQPAGTTTLTVSEDQYEVEFRLPDSSDLAALLDPEQGGTADDPRELLMERCLVGIRRDGRSAGNSGLPESVRAAVVRAMELADPLAAMQATVLCPSCSHGWEADFDIGSFLWTEIESWARRTLAEVHALARAYGWSEGDILVMSPTRRRLYLDLAVT